MKRIFTLLTLLFIFTASGFSQSHINYDRDTRWFMGINGGGTWHTQTETQMRIRGGYGFVVGASIGMHPKKMFSWDIRARFLHAYIGGQSEDRYDLNSSTTDGLYNYGSNLDTYQDSIGYFMPNFRTTLLSGSMELVLNTNRWRERTGWNFYLFGGIGIKGYHTKADLFDESGDIYDYDNLGSTSQTNLMSYQDGDFETSLVGTSDDYEVDWMPSFGAGISYQLSPAVAMGLEHKMTWTRNNTFDGMPNDVSSGAASGLNDIYHYSALTFKFHLFNGSHYVDTTSYTNFDPVDPVDNGNGGNGLTNVDPPAERQKPIVDIYDPGSSPYTTTYSYFKIKANIHYVSGKSNVTFKQNGNINNNFSYNPNTDKFESNVVLQPGQNLFEITGVNEAGSDYETTIIIYQEEVVVPQPPIVTITNPPYSPYTVNYSAFSFAAKVLNVDSKSQIKVYFNGVYLSNFSYNSTTNMVAANLNLHEGTNTVTITATNSVGSDSKTANIIYVKPEVLPPPVVSFITPSIDPYSTNSSSTNILASVLNVDSKNDITVKLNGYSINSFSFNTTTKHVSFYTNLIEGANIIEITGVNTVGQDSETTTIIYNKPHTRRPPIVTFENPSNDPLTVYNASYNVLAKVLYVDGASDITLKINGVQSTAFTYSPSSNYMNFNVNLLPGSNVIEVKGVNDDGEDTESTTIIYRRTILQAPPVVDISYPAADNQVFNSPNITLIASVLNVNSSANISVLVNGVSTTAFSYNNSTKVLNLPLTLIEGSNTVQITGSNSAGTDSETRIILYQIPQVPQPPTVNFTNPPTSTFVTANPSFTVTAVTTNIDSKNQITLLQNGTLINDSQYTLTSTNQIIYNSTLINGNNIFEVIVTNNDGTASDLAIVTLEIPNEPCIIPTVGYISPVPYSTVNDPNVNIDAQINNYSPGTTIELKINGISLGYMSFNTSTSIASKDGVLNEGSNAVQVIVTNDCGTNHATFTLNYEVPEAPCEDPLVTALDNSSITTQETTITVQAGVLNIDGAQNISATLNGTPVNFNYDAGTNTITVADANLSLGNNSIVITASTDCGSSTIVYNVVREECNLPVISNLSQNDNFTSTDASITLTANITNAVSGNIQLLINGISQAFAYNETTGQLSAGVDLNVGSNSIVIIVTNDCGTTSQAITGTREIPCQQIAPSYITPNNGTASVTTENYEIVLHVNGTLEQSGINVTVNGSSASFTFDEITGDITISNITLVDGNNTISVTMTNACSSTTIDYEIQYDGCQEPTIAISNPNNGTTVNNSTLAFAANVTNANGSGNIDFTVNGTTTSFNFNETSGVLTSDINLVEGSNTIVLTVNGCEVATQTTTVTYEIPCTPLSYSLIQPASNSQTVTESLYNLSIGTNGIENNSQVSATLNGQSITTTFDIATNIVSIDGLTLVEGANIIMIGLTNDCSYEMLTYNIQYNGCQPPVITLGANQSSVTIPTYNFSATITNIADQSELEFLVNGAPTNFVFDATTGSFQGDVTLNEGNTSFTLNANGCESVSQTFNANYTIPCEPIAYTLGTPNQLSTSVGDETYTINLFAQNVLEADITVTVNGNSTPFTYDNDIITINNFTLVDGSNPVIITMTNDCSNETITYDITHDGCDAPVINLSANSDASTEALYNFTASLQNVENQNQLVLTVNGTVVPVTFDQTTNIATAQFSLNEGSNSISLAASTCDDANESMIITYTIPCVPITYTLGSPGQLNSQVQGDNMSISLNTQNVESNSDITVTLNGTNTAFTFSNGLISISNITLLEGANTVVVTLTNPCSNETITYNIDSDQCDAPVISLVTNNIDANDPMYNFTGTVTNIDNQNQIVLLVNGNTVNANLNNGNITAQFSLVPGPNTVELTANGCETTSQTITINYTPPCNVPVISLNSSLADVNDPIYTFSIDVQNINGAGDLNVTVNGNAVTMNGSGPFTSQVSLQPGANTINVEAFGCDTVNTTYTINYEVPCDVPVITVNSSLANVNDPIYTFSIDVQNISGANDLNVTVNGNTVTMNGSGPYTSQISLQPGANSINVEAFGCDTVNTTYTINYNACDPVTYTLNHPADLNQTTDDEAFYIEFSTTNVTDGSNATATVNGTPVTVTFNNGNVMISDLNLQEGTNTIIVNISNDCSNETITYNITFEEEEEGPCGPRFNPGNSDWQFCLITPTGTYNRDDLAADPNFTYTGPASSAYFKPIAGGGDAIVNGNAYPVNNGQYYLFTGNLTVDVGSNHPGSMGQWEICISADAEPVFGNGNSRPDSPCEDNGNGNGNGNSGGDIDVTVGGDGGVTVDQTSCATITCLGESVIYNNSQEAYVSVEYTIDDGSNWYAFNGGNNVSGGESTIVQVTDNSTVAIKATCVNESGNWTNVEVSNDGSQYAIVLQNGDPAPAYDPASGQAGLETFLAGYIDNNGNVTIGPNDVIYLFELRFVGNYGIDYQDCVMLIEFDEDGTCSPPSGSPSSQGMNHGQVYMTPTFDNIAPSSTNETTQKATYSFSVKANNTNDAEDVRVHLNGNEQKGVNYNATSQIVSIDLNLTEGSNEITVEATNGDKNAARTYHVTYAPVVKNTPTPVINNITPSGSSSNVDKPSYTFKTSISNVKTKADIEFKLNGVIQKNFTYNASNNTMTAVINLKEGANQISVKATNDDKTASKNYIITYTKPVVIMATPVISNITPNGSSATVDKQTYTFKASITEVKSKANIEFKLNGVIQKNFSFNTSNKTMTSVINLKEGANQISVKATNGDKTASKNYTITYNKPVVNTPTPTFAYITPNGSSANVTSSTYTLKTTINNVSSKANIKVYLNGKAFSGFTYSTGRHELVAVLRLKEGVNTIKIDAVNGDKSASMNYSITYTPKTTNGGDTGTNNTNTNDAYKTPVFTNVTPTSTRFTVKTGTFSFKTKIDNIQSKSNVKFYFNGSLYSGFTYSSTTKYVSAVLRLRQGANTIKIEATNGDKKASRTYTITYQPSTGGSGTPDNKGGNSGGTKTGGGTTNSGSGGTTNSGNKGGTTNSGNKGGGTTNTENKGGGSTNSGNKGGNSGGTKTGGGTKTEGGGKTETGGGKKTETGGTENGGRRGGI